MARRKLPEYLQETTNNPDHLGMPRNVRIGKREYRVAEPGDVALTTDGFIPGTLYRTRPLILTSVEQFISTAAEYITKSIELNKPITYTGLCCYLGTYRNALDTNYANNKDFTNAISQTKAMIENDLLNNSLNGVYQHQISSLILKNMHSFTDKVEVNSANINMQLDSNKASNREELLRAVEQARAEKAQLERELGIVNTTSTPVIEEDNLTESDKDESNNIK